MRGLLLDPAFRAVVDARLPAAGAFARVREAVAFETVFLAGMAFFATTVFFDTVAFFATFFAAMAFFATVVFFAAFAVRLAGVLRATCLAATFFAALRGVAVAFFATLRPLPAAVFAGARRVAAFAVRLRDHVELEGLETDLDTVVRGTLAPATFGLWINRRGAVE